MGPTWGRQDPGEPLVGHMNLAIWEGLDNSLCCVVFDVPSRTMKYLDANNYLQDHKQNQYIKGYKVFLEHRGTNWTELFL